MKLKDMNRVDLELLSYTDLGYMILKENKKPMNTPSIFKTICDLLGYSDSEYTNKIGDFYTSLTTDKRFLLLDPAEWDLKENHVVKVELEDEEEEIEETEDEEEEIEEEVDEDIEVVDDDTDDDDLSIVSEDEMEDEE